MPRAPPGHLMDTHQRREQGAGRADDHGWGGDARPTCSKGQALTLSPPGPRHPPHPRLMEIAARDPYGSLRPSGPARSKWTGSARAVHHPTAAAALGLTPGGPGWSTCCPLPEVLAKPGEPKGPMEARACPMQRARMPHPIPALHTGRCRDAGGSQLGLTGPAPPAGCWPGPGPQVAGGPQSPSQESEPFATRASTQPPAPACHPASFCQVPAVLGCRPQGAVCPCLSPKRAHPRC